MPDERGSRFWRAIGGGLVAIIFALAAALLAPAPARAASFFVAADIASAGAPMRRDKPCLNGARANLVRCLGQTCAALPGGSDGPLAPPGHAGRRMGLQDYSRGAACGDWRLERPPRAPA